MLTLLDKSTLNPERALKTPISLPHVNWAQPTRTQLRDEFHEWEIQRLLTPRGYETKEHIEKAFEFFTNNVKPRTITFDSLDLENQFRFRFPDYESLKKQVTSYGGPKDPDRIIDGIRAGDPIPMPVVVETRNQILILAGGATRISIAGLANLPITVLVFHENHALLRHASDTIINIKEFTEKYNLLPELTELLKVTPRTQSADRQSEAAELDFQIEKTSPKKLYLKMLNLKVETLRFQLNRTPTLQDIQAA